VRSVVAGVGAPQIGFVLATVLARLRSYCDGIGAALRSRDSPLARLRSRALPKTKACWRKGQHACLRPTNASSSGDSGSPPSCKSQQTTTCCQQAR
jgi:hypothetical protein